MQTLHRVTEVAAILDLSVPTVYRLISEGEIPSIRIGRSIRVGADDLEARLDEQREGDEDEDDEDEDEEDDEDTSDDEDEDEDPNEDDDYDD